MAPLVAVSMSPLVNPILKLMQLRLVVDKARLFLSPKLSEDFKNLFHSDIKLFFIVV